jgi:hypothetical protein
VEVNVLVIYEIQWWLLFQIATQINRPSLIGKTPGMIAYSWGMTQVAQDKDNDSLTGGDVPVEHGQQQVDH